MLFDKILISLLGVKQLDQKQIYFPNFVEERI